MRRFRLFLPALVLLAVCVPAVPAMAALSDVPTPTVTGPVPSRRSTRF